MQIFLKFVNFYRRFIKAFSCVANTMFAFLKSNDKNKFHILFVFISQTRKSFERFRKVFFTALLFRHFDSNRKIKFKTNASDFVISKIIFQLNKAIEQWHFIIYWFQWRLLSAITTQTSSKCLQLWNRANNDDIMSKIQSIKFWSSLIMSIYARFSSQRF